MNGFEEFEAIASLEIRKIPVFLLFKDGEEKERLVGYKSKADLQLLIDKYV
jgi:thiol-disulfide isomerase/thioredoxin